MSTKKKGFSKSDISDGELKNKSKAAKGKTDIGNETSSKRKLEGGAEDITYVNNGDIIQSKKSKGLQHLSSDEKSNKINKSKKDKDKASRSREEKQSSHNKAHYPKITFSSSNRLKNLSSSSSTSSSHRDRLVELVREVCVEETKGLSKYLRDQQSYTGGTGGKKGEDLLEVLVDILSSLPDEVHRVCPQNATFQPEMSSEKRRRLRDLESHVSKLEEYEALLARYERDNESFTVDFKLIDGNFVDSLVEEHLSKHPAPLQDKVDVAMSQYHEVLEDMEKSCDVALAESQRVKSMCSHAKTAQQTLFDTCAQVSSSTGELGSLGVKDILKGFR